MAIAAALVYALFVWWFATGLVLLLVLRARRGLVLTGAAGAFVLSLWLLSFSGGLPGRIGVYLAFSAAILLWGTQEIAFLTGAVTGPRALPCPPNLEGGERLRYALAAILYHEAALIGSGMAVLAVTWHAANQVGALTFLVLWVMRLSAKLNLYLGVPVPNDQLLPKPIAFLGSYFRRGPVNAFFPVAVVLSVLLLSGFVTAAAGPDASGAATIGYSLVAALTGLAILEHVFMLVPLPIDRLWAWSAGRRPSLPTGEPSRDDVGKIERVAATSP